MNIAVVGAGGIGTHLIHLLVNTMGDDDSITVFDGDKFEDRNISRQIFNKNHVGINKAEAMRRMYHRRVDIRGIKQFLTDPDQLYGFDVVFCVPDNNLARRIAIDASDKFEFMLIIAGNESTSANAIVWNQRLNKVGDTHPLVKHPEYLKDAPESNSCADVMEEKPQTIVANAIAASMCMGLYIAWADVPNEFDDSFIGKYMPAEYVWGKTFFEKHTPVLTCQKKEEDDA